MDQHRKHIIVTSVIIIGIVIIAIALVLAWDRHSARLAQISHEKVIADQVINQQNAQVSTQANAQLQQLVLQSNAQTTQLRQSLAQLQSQLKVQQQKDQNAAPPELITRWSQLVQVAPSELQVTPDNRVLASLVATRATVVKLDETVVLESEVKQQGDLILKNQEVINQCQFTIVTYQTQITGLEKTQKDSDAACKADIAKVKADARKHSLIYTAISFIGGIVFGKKF